eukprot:TRINITY_DN18760_c0_g1_i1.p1 TRINITY_DN18760_c0_g1~~TRINITY_DN18760_c0_g1_i1.p1  ORF type:complete len:195 (-),score=65.23 TRINITY_DN18760_c0_g1_i1:117-701(-)
MSQEEEGLLGELEEGDKDAYSKHLTTHLEEDVRVSRLFRIKKSFWSGIKVVDEGEEVRFTVKKGLLSSKMVVLNEKEEGVFEIERDMFYGGLYYLRQKDKKIATVKLRVQMKMDSEMDITIQAQQYKTTYGDELYACTDSQGWKIVACGRPLAVTTEDKGDKLISIQEEGNEDFLVALNLLILDLLLENLTHFG